MSDRRDAIGEWQERLESAFRGPRGIVGERVLRFAQAEEARRSEIIKSVHGFTVVMDSFMDFAIMTFEEASGHNYTPNVFDFAFNTVAMQRLRVALKLFYDGYDLDAATHLRTVYEISFYLAAVLHGHFWFNELFSPKPSLDFDKMPSRKILTVHRQHRVQVGRLVARKIRGEESGLSAQEREDLDVMFGILHHQVHYGIHTISEYVRRAVSSNSLPDLFPGHDLQRSSMFCITIVCAAWTLLRVLPYISNPERFSASWQSRYMVLDEAFAFYVGGWDKPIGSAFLKLMRLQFTFDPVKAGEQVARTRPHGTNYSY